ncbi:MAG: serine dehydratase subunit alpha family protein [Lachnospiraceae bacterium]|nr:serine dehydratase subunit alpha family protein [Lachnospiraceae bacterium]
MDRHLYENYLHVLREELVPALGCTEPISVAYTAAYARSVLGAMPERVRVACSGNIVKNVKGVTVPNSGGMKGIEAAAAMGLVAGDYTKELEILDGVTEKDIRRAEELVRSGIIRCELARRVDNLYISVLAGRGEESAEVIVSGKHTRVAGIWKNGRLVWENREEGCAEEKEGGCDKSLLNLEDIFRFAEEVRAEDISEILDRQISCNLSIAEEGLKTHYGVNAGKVILRNFGSDIRHRAVAYAAAGSDARMSGCSMPVVINSGSGNQGMTVSLPVIEYARETGAEKEKLYRALALSNLISIYQKSFIGRLSAYCGAVSAAAGAVSGIAWLDGAGADVIARTITNTICTAGGMVCDGAKPSCASKIAAALEVAMLGYEMAKEGFAFQAGEGLVMGSADDTIKSVGQMAREGMASTDEEILEIMMGSRT